MVKITKLTLILVLAAFLIQEAKANFPQKRMLMGEKQADPNDFIISKGINIASWLSTPKYNGAARASFFTEADVQLLSELGFDHIRICIDEVQLWDDSGNKIKDYAFDLLHNAINWCSNHNMRVIVDMHTTRNHRFTNTENTLFTDVNEPAKFVKLWEDISDELKNYPNSLVAYELLNEPVSADAANWNRVSALVINAIRAKEADRTIIVGVCTAGGSVKYSQLTLPSTHRIMATFHYYGPYLLTYYGASSTTGGRKDIPISYPGQLVPDEWISALPTNWQSTGRNVYNKAELTVRMKPGFDMATRLGVPVFVGEFGTWNVTPEPARSNWYRDVVAIMQENNAPYTSFDYKGAGYSVVSESRTLLYPSIIGIITGNTSLPVKLIAFEGKKTASGNLLSWATSQEKDNQYFELEKSKDGVNFSAIKRIAGAMNTSAQTNYSYWDTNPSPIINYYRLKQVDVNGKYTYSAPLAIDNKLNSDGLKLYPNPGNGIFTLLNMSLALGTTIKVYNAMGNLVKSVENSNTIDISKEKAGLYFIQVIEKGKVSSIKYLKQ